MKQKIAVSRLDDEAPGPLLVTPSEAGMTLGDAFEDIAALVEDRLVRSLGLLFRGFAIDDPADFHDFSAGFGAPLLPYEFGSTPRSHVRDGVYTATEYPAHQRIPLHNEQSYTTEWPMRIWFYCQTAPVGGGETPLADSRRIHDALDPGLRARFAARRLMYVRNYGAGLDVPWQKVFNTGDRGEVEVFCRQRGIDAAWLDDGSLRTRQICQAVAAHPVTGEAVWFNQAHLFHVSGIEPALREVLLETVGEAGLPRNVYYGDGTPIEESALAEIRGVLQDATVTFPWRQHDILMLDNMLTAHGRMPFKGPRRVLVAMAGLQRSV